MTECAFDPTNIAGCFVISFAQHKDERGTFQRKFSRREFDEFGLTNQWVQTNVSSNLRAGTLRGFHFQREPAQEVKLVTCVSGRIFDVALDLRSGSKSFLQTFSLELAADENVSLYIPKGVAHAYLTLQDNTTVLYHVSSEYSAELTSGVSYLDPKIDVKWPLRPTTVSEADKAWPLL